MSNIINRPLCGKSLSGKGADPLRRGQETNEIDSPPKGQTPFRIGLKRIDLMNRREVLQAASCGFGWLALCDLATRVQATEAATATEQIAAQTHFPAKAKRVIFLCMRGGPSHVDTFDYKPDLSRNDGKPGKRAGPSY
jgi:hypothetical protein